MSQRLQNSCSWSSSRESTFEECKKKYWYTYYGAWEGWPLNYRDERKRVDPLAQYLYRLKNMQPVAMFIGKSVHKTIETYIRKIMVSRKLPPFEQVLQDGLALVRTGFEDSKKKAWMTNPKHHTNLFEDYYGKELPPQDSLEQKVTACLHNWYTSPIATSLLLHPSATFGDVEKLMQFSLSDQMECIVVFDLYLHWKKGTPDEKLMIFDWKTGSENGRIAKQMAAYALAATHFLKMPLSSVILSPFYLADGPLSYKKIGVGLPDSISEKDMEETRQAIERSLTDMKQLHKAPEMPDPRNFPYTSEKRACASCPFKEVCEKASFQTISYEDLRGCAPKVAGSV